jgi:hypothetical protein
MAEFSLMGESPFTNGIINKTNSLVYHFDKGNYPGAMTCLFLFKKDIHGGKLVLPLLDLAIDADDGSALLFDGNFLLHGVSPIRQMSEESYRYTVVYYTLEAVKKWRG